MDARRKERAFTPTGIGTAGSLVSMQRFAFSKAVPATVVINRPANRGAWWKRPRVLGRVGLGVAGVGSLAAMAGLARAERKQSRVSRERDLAAANSYRDLASKPPQVDGHTANQYRAMQTAGGLQRDAGGNMKRADRKANPRQLKRLENIGFARADGESDVSYNNRARAELSRNGIRNDIKGDAADEWLRRNREEMDKPMPRAYANDKRYAQPKLFAGYETGKHARAQR